MQERLEINECKTKSRQRKINRNAGKKVFIFKA